MRLDQALVARGFVDSRARAQALIKAGAVRVDGVPAQKPSLRIDAQTLTLAGDPLPYVSRGALKLLAALDAFDLSVMDTEALDLGASTGGFTQVLLERGAARVHAVDVGHGQLAKSVAEDPRVVPLEGVNVRALKAGMVPPPDVITADLSFISLAKALPQALSLAGSGALLVTLIKPQFEVGPGKVGKKGVLRDADARLAARDAVLAWLEAEGWRVQGVCDSPVKGGDGNTEYLAAARKAAPAATCGN